MNLVVGSLEARDVDRYQGVELSWITDQKDARREIGDRIEILGTELIRFIHDHQVEAARWQRVKSGR